MIYARCQEQAQGALKGNQNQKCHNKLVHEVIQPQEQLRFQAEGVQPIKVPSNEPQQLVIIKIHFHQILAEQEERKEQQVLSIGHF